MRTGIAICTYNRVETLRHTVARVRAHTKAPHELIVVDDGSTDGTAEEMRKLGVKVLSARNRGIAWNKNRALFYLKNIARSDAIILLEDDTFPLEDHWENDWIEAIARWGHINLAARYWGPGLFHDGDGSPAFPYKSIHVSAQCEGFSAESLEYVGYMDSRFRGWGMEHVEHTGRMLKAGFGGELTTPIHRPIYYLIDSNLEILFREESVGLIEERKQQLIAESIETCRLLNGEKVKRDPWMNDEEMVIFLGEFNPFRNRRLYFSFREADGFLPVFDSGTGQIRFVAESAFTTAGPSRVWAYYNGYSLNLCCFEGGKVSFLGRASMSAQAFTTVNEQSAIGFQVDLDRLAGMYFRSAEFYLSCDKGNDNLAALDRNLAGDWERFFVSHGQLAPQCQLPYFGVNPGLPTSEPPPLSALG